MEFKKRYLGIVGIAILAYILMSLDLAQVARILQSLNPGYFAIAVVLGFFGIALKGYKYQAVVKAHNKDISLADSTKYFLIGFFLSLVTPGRIGEIARALYANQKINSMGKSISTVVFDRVLDLGIIIAMGLCATLFFYFSMEVELIPLWAIALVAIGFAAIIFLVSRRNIVKLFLRPVFHAIIPEKLKGKAKTSFGDFYASAGEAMGNRKELAIAFASGIVVWGTSGFVMYFYLLALGINIPLFFVFLLFPAMAIVEMVPISFSGLGTREATAIVLLGIYGVTPAEAVAFSVLVFAASYLLNALIGFVLFTRETKKISLDGLQ